VTRHRPSVGHPLLVGGGVDPTVAPLEVNDGQRPTPVGEPIGSADEQNPGTGNGLEGEHIGAAIATEP
jgi:hypothetical protein